MRDLQVEIPLSRGTVRAVDGASFHVERGQALGLVGESGCGKSMALRAVAGAAAARRPHRRRPDPVRGRGPRGGQPSRLRDLRGKGIAMIFQEPMTALNPVMRVGAQIAEAPLRPPRVRPPAQARERRVELMQLVGIPDPERRCGAYPHELSGGMRQRVMIAIALVLRAAADPRATSRPPRST